MKRAWIAFWVTAAVLVPARVWAMFRFADPSSGFYTDGGRAAGVLSLFLALGVAAAVFLSFRGPAPALAPGAPMRSVPSAVSAALAGVALAAQSVASLAVPSAGEDVPERIFAAFGILAAAAFLAAAYGFAAGAETLRRAPLLALLPSVWGCFCLVMLFIRYAATVNRLENLYHTCTVVLLLLFLFSQAKLLTGIHGEKSGRQVFGYGFAAAATVLATAVPNLALYFSGREMPGAFPVGLHLLNLFLAAYILCFLAAAGKETNVLTPAEADAPAPGPREEAPREEKTEQDVLKECADFLNGRCGWSEKFVKIGETAPNPAKNEKS